MAGRDVAECAVEGYLDAVATGLVGPRAARSRSAEEINGPRWVWAMLSAVNIVGPIAYFAFGRRSAVRAAVRRPPTVSEPSGGR
jgi:hypothetical protein